MKYVYVVAKENGGVNGVYHDVKQAVKDLQHLEMVLEIKGYHIYKCEFINGYADFDTRTRLR